MTKFVVPLADLCKMDRRQVRPAHEGALSLPFVGVEHVVAGSGVIDFDSDSRVGSQKSAAFRFDARHVLYGKLRPYLNKVATPGFAGKCSTELIPLLPQDGVDRDYLAHLLRRRDTVDFVMAAVTGSRMPRADMKVLLSMRVPLPPPDEQRRIVAILNRAAKIERLRAGAAERLREFVPALFERMFGDPVQNPKGWAVAKLGEVGTLDRGRSRHRPRNAPELYGGPYPFVQTGDVAGSSGIIRQASQCYSDLGLRQSKMWPAGTLCITIAANIGETGVLAFDACFPDSVVGFVPKQDLVTVEYVQGALDSMQARLEEGAPMAAQRNINLRILRALPLALPPVELQRRFGRVVRQARRVAETVGAGTASASKVTQALMRMLLGKPA